MLNFQLKRSGSDSETGLKVNKGGKRDNQPWTSFLEAPKPKIVGRFRLLEVNY